MAKVHTDLSKAFRIVRQTPGLPYHLAINSARFVFHPLERYLLDGLSLAPRSISIMITDRCNLRCRMCHYSYSESPDFSLNRAGFMSLELFNRILETCPGKPIIALTGGEPLLHRQVIGFIYELKRRGFLCSLTTNGSFLEAKAVELCLSGLDLLVVSIDGDLTTHNQIRGQGVFERAVSGIQEILRQPVRPLVAISTVITDINYRKLKETLTLAEALGVDILNYNHLWIQTDQMVRDQGDNPDLTKSGRVPWRVNTREIDSNRVYDSLYAIHKKHRILVNEYPKLTRDEMDTYYHQPEELIKVGNSRCAWQVMKIYPDGEVGICREFHAGNVREQPLRKIWNNPRYRKFRLYLREKGTCPICSRCCLVFSRM